MGNSRTIRIFVSSTFTDFEQERNLLMQHVFNRLEELCRKNRFSFQIVDLRWGITQEDARDHRTVQICFDEIERCQEVSRRPNFLVLSGFRYGWVPLPAVIRDYEWQLLTRGLEESDDRLRLLKRWYWRDYNSLEGDWLLGETEEQGGEEEDVKTILFSLARERLPQDDPNRFLYGCSATEQEIHRGLLDVEGASEHTLVLMREGEDYAKDCDSGAVHSLRSKLRRHMSASGGRLIFCRSGLGEHEEQEIYDFLERIILERIREAGQEEERLTLYERKKRSLDKAEAAAAAVYHDFGNRLAGLEECCARQAGKAFLLTGTSGSGKSTLLLKYGYEHAGRVAISCVNANPSCARMAHALWFLAGECRQKGWLSDEIGEEPDTQTCVTWFEGVLAGLTVTEPVVLVLDCVEQILDWAMVRGSLFEIALPKNVTLVVSCISSSALRKRERELVRWEYVLKLPSVNPVMAIVKQSLGQRGRTLTNAQECELKRLLPQKTTPLYASLLAVQCLALRSPSPEEPLPGWLKESLRGGDECTCVRVLAERLGAEYPVLARRTLGYLAVCREGLGEQELLELLSRDPVVIEDIERNAQWSYTHIMQAISVPWSRLYHSLRSILAEVEENGYLLLRFSHSLLRRVTEEGLKAQEKRELLILLRDYFLSQPNGYSIPEEGRLQVNLRRLDELYPAMKALHDLDGIRALLADPEYLDAHIRAGRYHQLREQESDYRWERLMTDSREASSKGQEEQETRLKQLDRLLVLRRPILSRWPDSYLALSCGIGAYDPASFKSYAQGRAYFSRGELPAPFRNAWEDAMEGVGGYREGMTLNSRYIVLKQGDRLRVYDYLIKSELDISCSVPAESGALYFSEGRLILRLPRRRITLRFEPEDQELAAEQDEPCPHWDHLFFDKDRLRQSEAFFGAGGWVESECFLQTGTLQSGIVYHVRDRAFEVKPALAPGSHFVAAVHGAKAAVLLDHKRLWLVDLIRREIQEEYACPGASGVAWDEEGKRILLVPDRGKMAVLYVGAGHGENVPRPFPVLFPEEIAGKQYPDNVGGVMRAVVGYPLIRFVRGHPGGETGRRRELDVAGSASASCAQIRGSSCEKSGTVADGSGSAAGRVQYTV